MDQQGTPTKVEIAAALEFVRGYDGEFQFLREMRARAEAEQWFSPRQITAIIRCQAHEVARPVRQMNAPVDEGMYRHDGEIFKVQRGRESGNLYAKRLVEIGGKRLADEDERDVHFEFQYAAGAIRMLTADERMTLDEARAFGIRFGVCCVCGASLKDADSVRNGIGPVCAKNNAWRAA
jgi:hypothetical protein